jgi:HlyD family secretion protein
LFFVVFIFISIIFINVKVAVSSIIIFLFFYSIFYIIIKKRLKLNSKLISESSEKKYKLINEGFDGIKDIIIANANQFFINRFNKVNQIIYSKSGNIVFLSQLPRNILEVLAIGVILFVLIFLLSKNSVKKLRKR